MFFKIFAFFLLNILIVKCCKDENNNPVDWYVLYKLPKKSHSNPLIQKGHAYVYITAESAVSSNSWILSNFSINDPKSIPGLTLSDFYKNKTLMHLFYNDEAPPNNKNENLGHTKGVLASDSEKGFWLVHSVPLYPNLDKYGYPKTGENYGQSFLCLSLDLKNLNDVGFQLLYNEPHLYGMKLDSKIAEKIPNVAKVIEKKFVKEAPHFNLKSFATLGNKNFISFAKNRHFGKDLYDWVATELKENLLVETWLRGQGTLNSDCSKKFYLKNIKSLNFNAAKLSYESENDHSKWTVAINQPWFCIGDINRQEHQKMRGGGTVCTNLFPKVWLSYRNLIKQIEPCFNNTIF